MSGAPGAAPIGVLGGAFDPVHNGHLRLAIEAREALSMDHVRLVPVGIPNHRRPPKASGKTRVEMLRAGAQYSGFMVDTREVDRGGISYTVETLESLREDYPGRPMCLIMGLDAFNGLSGWHRWRDLLSLCHLIVATRPGADRAHNPALDEFIGAARVSDPVRLSVNTEGCVYFLPIPLLPISSSDIRERLRRGRSVAHLVPDAVLRLIEQDRSYTTGGY